MAPPLNDRVIRSEGLATVNARLLINMIPKMAVMAVFVAIYVRGVPFLRLFPH